MLYSSHIYNAVQLKIEPLRLKILYFVQLIEIAYKRQDNSKTPKKAHKFVLYTRYMAYYHKNLTAVQKYTTAKDDDVQKNHDKVLALDTHKKMN